MVFPAGCAAVKRRKQRSHKALQAGYLMKDEMNHSVTGHAYAKEPSRMHSSWAAVVRGPGSRINRLRPGRRIQCFEINLGSALSHPLPRPLAQQAAWFS
ncbi:hypothetical protein VZT92_006826 [Zoarces viviparus]|uniref:Uncharacterized protein n=1 Tax=Zoarces viviparus TaxID=48416 RepID=A0AAW1FSB3_ZOAVI